MNSGRFGFLAVAVALFLLAGCGGSATPDETGKLIEQNIRGQLFKETVESDTSWEGCEELGELSREDIEDEEWVFTCYATFSSHRTGVQTRVPYEVEVHKGGCYVAQAEIFGMEGGSNGGAETDGTPIGTYRRCVNLETEGNN